MPNARDTATGQTARASSRLGAFVSRNRADLLAVGFLWFLCVLFLWRLFSPVAALRLHVVAGDFTNQFYPFRYFASAEWQAGRVPLWNPYVFSGHPFLADVQTAVFYPLSLLTALIGAVWGALPRKALELEMALHYPLAALFSYLLGRQVLGSRRAAVVTAVVFTFSGFLTSYPAQQLAMLETAVWLPLVVLCFELAATRPKSGFRWHAAGGAAYGAAVLAGHPQTAMFIAYSAIGYLALRSLTAPASGQLTLIRGGVGATPSDNPPAGELTRGLQNRLVRLLLGVVVFGAVGFGVSAVQLLPTVELIGQSTRADMTYEAAAYGYEKRALLGILLPNLRGEKALYVGILPLALAGLAVWRALGFSIRVPSLADIRWRAKRRGASTSAPAESSGHTRFLRRGDAPLILGLAVLAALATILSVGGKTFLFRWLYLYAPGFDLFRDQERIIYLFAFAVSLLAGFGARDVLGGATARWSTTTRREGSVGLASTESTGRAQHWFALTIASGVVIVGTAFLAAGAWRLSVFDPYGSLRSGVTQLVASGLAAAVVVAFAPRLKQGSHAALLLAAVVALDLFVVNLGNNLAPVKPDASPDVAAVAPWVRDFPEQFRVRGRDDTVFPPNYAAVWMLPTINGDTPFEVKRVHDLLAAENAEWRRWQALNVKFQISRDATPNADGLELAFRQGDVRVYRVVYSLPRVWALRDFQVADSPANALSRLLDPKLHPGDTVVLEEQPSGAIAKGPRPDSRIESYSPQRVEVWARGDGDSLLVLADTWYPGWRAAIDGTPTRLMRANYATRAVELPAGEHRIVFSFQPTSFYAGAAVSAVTLAVLVVWLVWVWRERRTSQRRDGSPVIRTEC